MDQGEEISGMASVDLYHDEPEPSPTRTKRFSIISLLIIVGLLVIVGSLIWAFFQNSQQTMENGYVPDFAQPTLEDGRVFSLSAQQGNVVVINFWGSWCGPCRVEAPLLEDVYQRYRAENVIFIGIAIEDNEAGARGFIEEFGISYPNILDQNFELQDAFEVASVPRTLILNRDGRLVRTFFSLPVEIELMNAIEEALES